ncbi:hypothetical protein BCCR75501_02939 [Burkholderia sola]|nr:hypothetical protein BCCR75501_02939 [Burkholderia cenocepacia]
MPSAIGRSKRPDSFGRSAGARLTVIRRTGNSNPQFCSAARTRSRLSRTSRSGSPTIENDGNPLARWTSTVTSGARPEAGARLRTTASDMARLLHDRRRRPFGAACRGNRRNRCALAGVARGKNEVLRTTNSDGLRRAMDYEERRVQRRTTDDEAGRNGFGWRAQAARRGPRPDLAAGWGVRPAGRRASARVPRRAFRVPRAARGCGRAPVLGCRIPRA